VDEAMPGKVLTARNVLTLKPRRGRTRDIYFDRTKGSPQGFALRVSETARSFYLPLSESTPWMVAAERLKPWLRGEGSRIKVPS
jgi:hypothetical protein